MYDVIIIGAGPVGLAAAIQAKRRGLSHLILDKGILCNSIYHYPVHMRFFTTADLLEIGNHPFPSTDVKPTRQQTLDYYRRVTELEDLNVLQHHEVEQIEGEKGNFTVSGLYNRKAETGEFSFSAKFVMIATGYFDNPRGLGGIPGEELDIASTRFDQPHRWFDHDVVIIGAGNSGAEAALELYRHGARVTIVHNHDDVKKTIKYWVRPDIKNRIKEGSINAFLPGYTKEIRKDGVVIDTPDEKDIFLPADKVFILTGYTPNISVLKKWGMKIRDGLEVELNEVFESNREGVFVIGSAGFGEKTNTVFIENGREHAVIAANAIADELSLIQATH